MSAPDALPLRYGSNVGQPRSRADGIAKVTGAATFAADNLPPNVLHAALATAPVARGRVAAMDVAAARAHPGVVEVWTPANRPPLAQHPDDKPTPFSFRIEALQDDRIRYAGQPVALVLAETPEAAAEGARLLAPVCEAEPPRLGFDAAAPFDPPVVGFGAPTTVSVGDLDTGFAAAARRIDLRVETPAQFHNALEPHAVVAQWEEGRLILDTPNQGPAAMRGLVAGFFGIAPDQVRIRTPFIGGGFGSKLLIHGPLILAALAARTLGRPVKLPLTRGQMFGPVGHRAPTRQDLSLALDADGRLTALSHRVEAITSDFEDFVEPAGHASLHLYAAPALSISHRAVRNDVGTPCAMRAPGEAPGSAALECALDEAAFAAGLDPLEFRLRNYAETDPATGRPFSSKALRDCYALGAERFGWAGRPLAPGTMRDAQGRLVGWGVGTAQYQCTMFQGEARATLRADGTALLETSGIDMGQGAWTALAQIAADAVGLPVGRVEFRAGDSDLPNGGVAGGSGHTATAGSALKAAGEAAVAKLAALAVADPASPLFGAGNAGVVARDGRLVRLDRPDLSESLAEAMARAGLAEVTATGTGRRDPAHAASHAMFTHGAVFAEALVDPDLGQIRVSRMVGVFAAGRIVNPKLARSQMEGGLIWGLSFALHEAAEHDPAAGRLLNADLAGYHIPVHADIPRLEVLAVDEHDPWVNPLGVKGLGEIGVTGSVGAIANAIWHATGRRARSFPIRIAPPERRA